MLIVLHDVTRLRHLEEVRRDFVANVSHELRTPITSIKGFVETLLDGALEDKDNALRFLQIMLRQVNRLDAIIGDLLALSRIEKGSDEQMIELAAESIRAVLQAAVEMCEKKAADKADHDRTGLPGRPGRPDQRGAAGAGGGQPAGQRHQVQRGGLGGRDQRRPREERSW